MRICARNYCTWDRRGSAQAAILAAAVSHFLSLSFALPSIFPTGSSHVALSLFFFMFSPCGRNRPKKLCQAKLFSISKQRKLQPDKKPKLLPRVLCVGCAAAAYPRGALRRGGSYARIKHAVLLIRLLQLQPKLILLHDCGIYTSTYWDI